MSEEESELEQANVGEVQQSVPRVFWRTKEMNTRGPDIADDMLLPQGTSTKNLYSFLSTLILTSGSQSLSRLIFTLHKCEYRQYVPSKPNPLGLKNFVLAARDGVVLDLRYVGSNTLPPQDMADLGCCNYEGITAKDKLGLLQYWLNLATAMAKYDGGTVNPIYSRSNSRGSTDTDSREISSISRNQDEPPKKKYRAIVAQPCPDQNVIYYELLKPNETITGDRYRLQLMRLSRSLARGLADQRFHSYEEVKKWIDSWIASKDM
ncbi:hypothetical protein EVAR_2646_1 [Eumeta japonica]|uniref:Mariner Mos1 transposase n=1 Tax=Eumeta variegata TaxID=151549 RepID=A0A4C1SM48_EUMVA|nr:hypothetical protein EVAR_2646_1 [Eumeta japonica]